MAHGAIPQWGLAKMDNSLNPIEDFINTGLANSFFKVFRVPLLFSNAPDFKTVYQDLMQRKGKKVSYPFARASTSGFAVNESTSFKPNTLARRGLHGQASHDNTLTYKLSLIPVITTYEIEIYVQDMPSLKGLSKQWLFASIKNTLKFTVNYGIGPIDIDVKMDKQLNVPRREGGATEVKEYVMTSNIVVNGYMSEDGLSHSQAVTELDYEGQVRALGSTETGEQVFLFESKWPNIVGPTASVDDTKET